MRQKRAITTKELIKRYNGDTGGILNGGGGIFPRRVMFRYFGRVKEALRESEEINPTNTSLEGEELSSHRERL